MTDEHHAEQPEQWAKDVRYLAKLADWAVGQGFCQIDELDDPDEWCFTKWDELLPDSDGSDYSAEALATAIITSIQRAFAAREADLVDKVAERISERIAEEFGGFWTKEDLLENIPGMIRECKSTLKSREASHAQ